MSEDGTHDQRDQTTTEAPGRQPGIPSGYTLHEPFQDFWPNVIMGISLSESFLPLGLNLISLIEGPIAAALAGTWFDLLISLVFTLILGIILSLFVNSIVSIFIILLLEQVLKSLRADGENLLVGALSGGLVALFLSTPFLFSFYFGESIDFCIKALLLATCLGQLGGFVGAMRTLRYRQKLGEQVQVLPTTIQFGTRELLVATFWCAVILTILKLLNLLTLHLLIMLEAWFVMQPIVFLTLWSTWSIRSKKKSSLRPSNKTQLS